MRLLVILGTQLVIVTAPQAPVVPVACADPTPETAAWWTPTRRAGSGTRTVVAYPVAPPLANAQRLKQVRGEFRLSLTQTLGPERGRVDRATISLRRGQGRVTGVAGWPRTLNLPVQRPFLVAELEERHGRLTLSIGEEPPVAGRNGDMLRTEDGPGIYLHVFGGDESRLWGRWVDGGMRGTTEGPQQGWFCLERV